MYKPLAYLVVTYFPTCRPVYDTSFSELVTKVRPDINSVEVHPKLSNNGHPVDGVLVGVGSLWPAFFGCIYIWTSLCFFCRFGEFLSLNKNTNKNNSKNGHNLEGFNHPKWGKLVLKIEIHISGFQCVAHWRLIKKFVFPIWVIARFG